MYHGIEKLHVPRRNAFDGYYGRKYRFEENVYQRADLPCNRRPSFGNPTGVPLHSTLFASGFWNRNPGEHYDLRHCIARDAVGLEHYRDSECIWKGCFRCSRNGVGITFAVLFDNSICVYAGLNI